MKLTNPLEDDPVLKDLLRQLERIETRRGFAKWKALFLKQFEVHLEGTNITKASQKYHSFAKRIDRLALLLKQLEGVISRGDCTPEKCTVEARKTLSELQKALTGMIEHTEALVPGTMEVEQKAGYTKFDMGAVLVRDGFVEYDRLVICNEILLHMKEVALGAVADRQLLKEMELYWNKVEAFYQIMGTDLGLHGAIMRCQQILRSEDDEFFEYENLDKLHPLDREAIEEARQEAEQARSRQKASGRKSETGTGTEDDEDDGKISEITTPTNSEAPLDAPASTTKKKKKNDLDDLDAGQTRNRRVDWDAFRKDPPKTAQRFEKVEIYGLDLPLRLIKLADEESATDLSDVSDYDSWCWELEMPEPEPPKVEEKEPEPEPEIVKKPEKKKEKRKEKKKEKVKSKPRAKSEPIKTSQGLDVEERGSKSREEMPPPRDDIDPLTGLPRKLLGLSKLDEDSSTSSEDTTKKKKSKKKGYNWNSEGYYHGDAAGWRIASSLRKTGDNDSKSGSG